VSLAKRIVAGFKEAHGGQVPDGEVTLTLAVPAEYMFVAPVIARAAEELQRPIFLRFDSSPDQPIKICW